MPSMKKSALPAIHGALVDVALIDGPASAAVGSISLSQWYEMVRTGEAPRPAVREPRNTRWRLIDVRNFWISRAEKGASNMSAAKAVFDKAKLASSAARAKRAAASVVISK